METFTKDELKKAFAEIGIESGDLIFFQSRLYGLGRPEGTKGKDELCSFFLDAIIETLGPDGTLVVPTFTTQVARFDEPFIVEETVPNYGLFPEFVFNRAGFIRSLHPLVSVAATGRLKEKICRSGGASNYGERSPFDMLAKLRAKNVFLGLEVVEAVTMAHYMEMRYGVPYIYNKVLKWRPVEKGVPGGRIPLAAVRYLEYNVKYDLKRLNDDLLERGCVRTARVGGGNVHCVQMDDLLETGFDGFDRDPYYLLAAPPEFEFGKIPYDGTTIGREKKKNMQEANDGLPESARYIAPGFCGIVENIFTKSSPSQKKAVMNNLAGRDDYFFRECEDISQALIKTVSALGAPVEKIADFYGMFCMDTLREQMEFRRSGEYRVKDYEEAVKDVYGKSDVMEYYMIGLMISQVLWDNHWKLLSFARSFFFAPFMQTSRSHVEIGPGHGWFTLLALRFGAKRVEAFDVSEQSAKMTKTLLETQEVPSDKWSINIRDIRNGIPFDDGSVDTFMAGEVLEHIPDPAGFLKEAHRILSPGGATYLTTAANAPALDHLYMFNSSDEIRDMIRSASFEIERDIEIVAGKIGDKPLINYGAVARKIR